MAAYIFTEELNARLNRTDTEEYDIILLPDANDGTQAGKIISVFGNSGSVGFSSELESYGLSLGKSDACVSVGGNYLDGGLDVKSVDKRFYDAGWLDDPTVGKDSKGKAYKVSIDRNYNINHLSYNDNYDSGAIHYRGANGYLVLTAQSGAGDAAKGKNGNYKVDDDIALRADSYGMFGAYNRSLANGTSVAPEYADGIAAIPDATASKTTAYTIHADNTLTVISDLAGKIEANVAAIHTSYIKGKDSKTADVVDDSNSNKIIAAGVKAGTLVLQSHFRATINAENSSDTFNDALYDPNKGYLWQTTTREPKKSDGGEAATIAEDNKELNWSQDKGNKALSGTTVAAVKKLNVENNEIGTYGIHTAANLDASRSIWAGSITATANNVSLLADCTNVLIERDSEGKIKSSTVTASRTAVINNNSISAYGIKSDGAVKIMEMSSLKGDSTASGNGNGNDQFAKITVNAKNNTVSASAKELDGQNPGSVSATVSDTKITAAGISGNSIEIGKIAAGVEITVNATGNKINVSAEDGKTNTATISDSGVYGYGIYAEGDAKIGQFDGNVNVNTGLTFTYDCDPNIDPGSADHIATGIYSGKNLRADVLGGTIKVSGSDATAIGIEAASINAKKIDSTITVSSGESCGIKVSGILDASILAGSITLAYRGSGFVFGVAPGAGIAAGSIKVAGAIATDINYGSSNQAFFGIYTREINAVAFSGNIYAANGIVVTGSLAGNSGDAFDISGTVTGNSTGVIAGEQLDIRISGNIDVKKGTAIRSENAKSQDGTNIPSSHMYDDRVELADGSYVSGEINLGAGTNTIISHSNAQFSGGVTAFGGDVNFNFILDGEQKVGTTFTVTSDLARSDIRTISVNINYAAEGETYKLINNAAMTDWDGQQISVVYQDVVTSLTIKETSQGTSGTVTVNGATVTANISNNTLQVTVSGVKKLDNLDVSSMVCDETKADSIALDWSGADFGEFPVEIFEIEYKIGNGKSISVKTSDRNYTIKGLEAGTEISYRMRLLGDDNANVATYWSDWKNAVTYSEAAAPVAINLEVGKIETKVTDVNQTQNMNGVNGPVAQLSWSGLDSSVVRSYKIEYCSLDHQITLEEVQKAGYSSIEAYVEGALFDGGTDAKIHTKVITGTQVDISGLANNAYVYWRITATDIYGKQSTEWQAGNSFRVYTAGDKNDPKFTDGGRVDSVLDYTMYNEFVKLAGFIGWDSAADGGSGVAQYEVKFTGDNGEVVTKLIESTENVGLAIVKYELSAEDIAKLGGRDVRDIEYTVVDANGNVIADTDAEKGSNTAEIITSDGKYYLKFIGSEDLAGNNLVVTLDNGETLTIAPAKEDITKYDYVLDIGTLGLTGGKYKYAITAIDYFGNRSSSINGDIVFDTTVPSFGTQKAEVNLDDKTGLETPEAKFSPVITWGAADDGNDKLGIRYYELWLENEFGEMELVTTIEADAYEYVNGNKKYKHDFDGYLSAREYKYEVKAYDYFGNSATLAGVFGSEDINAPGGRFIPGSLTNTVTATYGKEWVPGVDQNGNATLVEQEVFENATVTLQWDADFSDPSGVIYKVVVSNSETFSPEAKTYEFWTTSGDGNKMVFDYKTPGRSATIFDGMNTVYWYVVAYDGNHNKNQTPSAVGSFAFADSETGVKIPSVAAPAAPIILNVNDSYQDEKTGNYTRQVSVTWDSPDTLLGVYSFTVTLFDESGRKVVHQKNSIDLSDYLETDLSTGITVNADGTLTIENLREFFGTTIDNGKYKLVITSVDAKGQATSSAAADVYVDDLAPGFVTADCLVTPNNRGGENGSEITVSWAAPANADDVAYYEVLYCFAKNDEEAKNVTEEGFFRQKTDETTFSFVTFESSNCYFKIIAVDLKGNRSELPQDWTAVATPEKDKLADYKTKAELKEFSGTRYVTGLETVGAGDPADAFKISTVAREINGSAGEHIVVPARAMSISLTVDSLELVCGKTDDIQISIYTLETNAKTGEKEYKLLKSCTVKEDSRVFSDLYLAQDKEYIFMVESADKSGVSVSKYNITIDKKDLAVTEAGINAYDDKTDPEIITGNQSVLKDWVGIADTVDGKVIAVENSGRYTFSLDGIAASVKVTVYDVTDGWGKKKSVATISGTNKSVNGVETKELLLDNGRKYYVEVAAADKNAIGTDYELNINCIEKFPAPTTGDDTFDGGWSNSTSGWVGFKDGNDYVSKLEVGSNGGVYSFTISHKIASGDQAVKLTLWQEVTGKDGKVSLKSVKNITLSNKESAKNLTVDDLYLAGGTYYVEVSAPGYTKGQNSYYEFTQNGYEIPADTDVVADLGSISTVSTPSGWVGINATKDRYSFYVLDTDAGAYEFKLSGINGKELTATVYNAETGKKVISKTGIAGADAMTLAGNFAAGEYYIEFTANGKTANSKYELEIDKINANNADDKLYTAKQQATGQIYNEFDDDGNYTTGDWVGFTDATDFVKLDLDDLDLGSGLYDINITDIDNPVKLTLHQAIKNSNGDITSYAAVKSVTLKAGSNSGVLSGLLLNKEAEYYVEVTASGAAKGDNTGYKLNISSAAGVLSAPDTFDTAAGSKLYTFFAPADGGAYNFSVDADGLTAGTSVKLTVYELLTTGKTRSVKSVTVKADTIGSTGYLYLDQDAVANGTGIYMIEVKPANSKTAGNCTVSYKGYGFSDYVMNAENDNAVIITADDAATDKNWVGMGDASDTYKFTVADADEYSFELAGINGNNIKISIVNAATGKAVKSFTPGANSTGYKFTYDLAAGEYDIVISSADNGKSKYSEYTLDINRVEKTAPDAALVSNADDTWNLIAGDVNASASGFGDTIANWVGKGDVTDVFKINLDENGQIALDGYDAATDDALIAKEITLSLMDSNGKNIALTFDKASGVYESSIVLMADVDYYLNVKSAKPSEAGTAFQIAIK